MKHLVQIVFALVFLIFVQAIHAANLERLFAPKAELWDYWATSNETSSQTISHQRWTGFLGNNVVPGKDGIHRINYAMVSKTDRNLLKQYLEELSAYTITEFPRNQQLPYWINLYNALTVDVILQHYPVDSIRDIDISPGFFSDGPWGRKLITIQQQKLSLNDIEHRIIRPIWKDMRIHYALNCASIGCPNLQTVSFTAETIDSLLNKAMHDYVNHPRGVRVTESELTVSSIYSWFQEDFGSSEQNVLKHLNQYANTKLRKQLDSITFISHYEYDWSLNGIQTESLQSELTVETD